MDYLLWARFVAIAYFSGSVLYSRLLPKWLKGMDICALSNDHNPGAFNVFTHCGIPLGSVCVALDILKGAIPVYIAALKLDTHHLLFAAVIAAPVVGHAFSPWHRFTGGKCIATGFGVMIGMLPFSLSGLILAGIYIFFSTLFKLEPHRFRSIVSYSLFGIITTPLLLIRQKPAIALGYLIIDAVAIYKHHIDKHDNPEAVALKHDHG